MAALSSSQLADLVAAHLRDGTVPGSGLSIWDTAYAVGRAESGGRPDAVGDGGYSFGIWQVYLPAHPQYSAGWLMDPNNAAQAMVAISGGGTDWRPWCTWDAPACGGAGRGTYRAYLIEAGLAFAPYRVPSTPVAAVIPDPAPAPVPAVAPSSSGVPWLLIAGAGALLLAAGGAD